MSLKKELNIYDKDYIEQYMFKESELLDAYLILNAKSFSDALEYITLYINRIEFSMNDYIAELIKKINKRDSLEIRGVTLQYADLEKYKDYLILLNLNYLFLFFNE